MKIYILSCFVALILFSCSDHEIVNPLAGTWKFSYEEYTGCNDPVDNGHFDYACDASNCFKFVFDNSNNYEYQTLVNGSPSVQTGTYSVQDGTITLCSVMCDDPKQFKIENGTLLLTDHDDQGCTITKALTKI